MARRPRLKIVRRFQVLLPGLTQKNSERRPYPPGQHGQSRRSKASNYRLRMEAKQKLRFNYSLSDHQLRRYFKRAIKRKGDTGATLLQLIESRLDNVVFRAGFAPTIPAARQLVTHGHILINNRKVDIPSYGVKTGQKISLRKKSTTIPMVAHAMQSHALELPSYLTVDPDTAEATLHTQPSREDVPVEIQENLIIEFYSRVA